jgi:hypothetical protein
MCVSVCGDVLDVKQVLHQYGRVQLIVKMAAASGSAAEHAVQRTGGALAPPAGHRGDHNGE